MKRHLSPVAAAFVDLHLAFSAAQADDSVMDQTISLCGTQEQFKPDTKERSDCVRQSYKATKEATEEFLWQYRKKYQSMTDEERKAHDNSISKQERRELNGLARCSEVLGRNVTADDSTLSKYDSEVVMDWLNFCAYSTDVYSNKFGVEIDRDRFNRLKNHLREMPRKIPGGKPSPYVGQKLF